ncbi:hypothetical protein DIZ27_43660 [Streptomyces sp. NWU339]|nr:hypothetical protein DIZ27_43660 [Streptomyces sp. NWU339]
MPGVLIGACFFLNRYVRQQHGWPAPASAWALLPPTVLGGSIDLATLVMVSSHTGGTAGGFATGAAFAGCALPTGLLLRHR